MEKLVSKSRKGVGSNPYAFAASNRDWMSQPACPSTV